MSQAPEPTVLEQQHGSKKITRGQWMVLLAAFLGWMFDGLEMGIFPLVSRPALSSLLKDTVAAAQLNDEIKRWHGIIDAMFLLGAALGGLVFGWFGDKIGRVRAMAISILVYSVFTGLCYFAQSPLQIGLLRFISAIGMGGEWSLGVALVMEVWDAKHRPLLAGIIGAAANVGFCLIALIGLFFKVTESSWRWVMLMGAAPALLTFVIRIFVPESERWQESQKKAPSKPLKELFSGSHAGIALLAICFASVALLATWGSIQKIPAWVAELKNGSAPNARAYAQLASGTGAILGCLIAPMIGAWLGRRVAYFLLCALALAACQILFWGFKEFDGTFLMMVFLAGGISAAFYGWLPLYLPELFPTRVRATAQGIAFNFGRIFAAAGTLSFSHMAGGYAKMAGIVSLVYIIGMVAIWFAPETKGKPLPE